MSIKVRLQEKLAEKKMTLHELSQVVQIPVATLRTFAIEARAIRFATLSKLCYLFDCSPSDILEYIRDAEDLNVPPPKEY